MHTTLTLWTSAQLQPLPAPRHLVPAPRRESVPGPPLLRLFSRHVLELLRWSTQQTPEGTGAEGGQLAGEVAPVGQVRKDTEGLLGLKLGLESPGSWSWGATSSDLGEHVLEPRGAEEAAAVSGRVARTVAGENGEGGGTGRRARKQEER